jgi:hypothetical protein
MDLVYIIFSVILIILTTISMGVFSIRKMRSITTTTFTPKILYQKSEDINVTKKEFEFLNIANISFHYADEEKIRNFYDDYFKEATIKDLIQETMIDVKADIKGTLPSFVESKIGTDDLTKWISTVKLPEIPLSGMFARYQKEVILNNQVTLGLEEDHIELSIINDFENKVQILKNEFQYQFDTEKLENHKKMLTEKAAKKRIEYLENISDWVLLQGKFGIEKKDDLYMLKLEHPISNYLSDGKKVFIHCYVPISKIEESVANNYRNSINKLVPLKIYGKVWQPIDQSKNIWDLVITPLAIY